MRPKRASSSGRIVLSSKAWRDAEHREYEGWSNDDVSKLRSRYGITPAQYVALLTKQRGRCAICNELPAEGERLHIHHIHGHCADRVNACCVQAALCPRCNLTEGQLLAIYQRGGVRSVVKLIAMMLRR